MHLDHNLIEILWIGLWYLAVAALIWLLIFVYRCLNEPKWRDDHGDITYEVGYMEDSLGTPITRTEDTGEVHQTDDVNSPHGYSGGNLGSGPM